MKIEVLPDGNQVCVLLGPDPVQGFCGIGDDLPAALRDLATDLESVTQFDTAERAKLRIEIARIPKPTGKIHLVD